MVRALPLTQAALDADTVKAEKRLQHADDGDTIHTHIIQA